MIRETDTQTTENRLREAYDVIVIGAGAAGMMAAGTAARSGKRVLLLEKMEKSGRKVRISGKGRCNLTNARPPEEFLTHVRTNADFFEVAFAEFNNKATIRFFERMGVKLEIERGERVFPKSGKAWDVANALLEYCVENGVKIEYNCRVQEILTAAGKVYGVKYMNKRGFSRKEEAPAVILCTGGVSYPGTGSTGDGYLFAADLGHTIEPVRPSLTPLKSSHAQMKFMDKLLLRNVRVKLFVEGEEVREEFGEIGFSERGIEGAVALRVSRDAVDALIDEKRVKLVVDLKPGLTEEMLLDRIERDLAEMQPDEFFSELLRKLVPKALVLPIANELDIHSKNYVRKLSEAEKLRLVKLLKGFVFPITDYAPFPFAVVTAGGVRCDEVNKYTMESLKVKGLYFAGEVLDLDANTGGYNLQIAFSTGRLAGMLKK
ncbi:MAG: NAD(P)/FAD-dependent oxidoreductase [Alistipes sp.]|nr:NAD(P)/FAD-dependent oxidoreductase [Alistipes sp.]